MPPAIVPKAVMEGSGKHEKVPDVSERIGLWVDASVVEYYNNVSARRQTGQGWTGHADRGEVCKT